MVQIGKGAVFDDAAAQLDERAAVALVADDVVAEDKIWGNRYVCRIESRFRIIVIPLDHDGEILTVRLRALYRHGGDAV